MQDSKFKGARSLTRDMKGCYDGQEMIQTAAEIGFKVEGRKNRKIKNQKGMRTLVKKNKKHQKNKNK